MKVLTVGQHKGGIGKTTITRLVSIGAARAGHRVLVIDLDGQANLSQRFLEMQRDPSSDDAFYPPVHPDFNELILDDPDFDGISSSADIYMGGSVYPYSTQIENLDILPAHAMKLRQINKVDGGELFERVYRRLGEFMSDPAVRESYDLIVIDTPPSLDTPLPESAIYASTHLLIPAIMEQMCVEGLQTMLARWMKANAARDHDRIELIGIVVNMFQPQTALHTAFLEEIRNDPNLGPFALPCVLQRRISHAESDHENFRPDSVLTLRKSNLARREAEQLIEHVLTAMGMATEPALVKEVA